MHIPVIVNSSYCAHSFVEFNWNVLVCRITASEVFIEQAIVIFSLSISLCDDFLLNGQEVFKGTVCPKIKKICQTSNLSNL